MRVVLAYLVSFATSSYIMYTFVAFAEIDTPLSFAGMLNFATPLLFTTQGSLFIVTPVIVSHIS